MHHPASRRTPAVPLIGILCLAGPLLTAVATPASAAVPMASTDEEKVSIEIVITSDDKVTTTFLATTRSDDEQSLKELCVAENFSKGSATPEVSFSFENKTPTCKVVLNTSVSNNEYVTHDGDEYVVDTHVDSISEEDVNNSPALSVVFPGKVTDAGGGRIEDDSKNKVVFETFYDNHARGNDTSDTNASSTSGSTGNAAWIIGILVVLGLAAGGVITAITTSVKKSREQRYL
ncbi:hypothetical protein [Actinomyces viscosus]|uniref:Uncharacterized protein n=1 Tax=Actinomyces viscosus TaxID=1656 RepID=A0A3S4VKG6_ACTVI|nr:hypothetical protein [Actinomyces viscosus]VEI16746.1 Uncharacterised protein [Actinomyces viscosus]